MVTIVDPHIKRTTGYHVYDEGTRLGHFIKSADKGDYKGWCWPGDSSWVDFLSPAARVWWAGLFSLEMYKVKKLLNGHLEWDHQKALEASRIKFTGNFD